MVYRIYVEKKPGFDVEATGLKNELTSLLGIQSLTGLRLLNRYDVEGIDEELFNQCANTVFSEPPVDNTYAELPASDGVSFAVEYLPGQFDQRADSAAECIQLISQGERPLVRSARIQPFYEAPPWACARRQRDEGYRPQRAGHRILGLRNKGGYLRISVLFKPRVRQQKVFNGPAAGKPARLL